MLIRYVRLTFQPDKVDTFLAFLETNIQAIRHFPGCTFLEILQDYHQPNVFMTHSHWESEDDLEAYRTSELFAHVWGNTKIHFAEKPQAFSMRSRQVLP